MPSTRIALVLAAAASALATLPAAASAALPDLVSEPPGRPYVDEYHDGRLLLRFDGYVTNAAGAGPLEIRASDPDPAGLMRVVGQYRDVERPGVGGVRQPPPAGGAPTVVFEANDDHNHFHLKDAAEYSLWTPDGRAQVALAQKTEAGFCIEDSDPMGGAYSVATHNFCWQDRDSRGQSVLVMGISPGFRDVYTAGLAFQWIDASDVPPGEYRLAARVDPRNVLAEADEGNNGYATRPAVVPGHRARAVSARQSGGEPVTVTLAADSFGDYGSRRYRILSPPRHGTLDRAVGEDIAGSAVTYTPDPGHRGSDSFTYAAIDTTSAYPRTPAPAVATIAGDDVAVAIGGAPAELMTGLAAQLSASVANAPGGVTWSVDGTPGGSAGSGTITAAGLYVAPTAPPPAGRVTVRATSTVDPSAVAEATIRIVAAPTGAVAAPARACAEVPARREPTGSGRVTRSARQLLINQRISQAAVRRANAITAWLDAGVEGRDLCGGAIGAAQLGPGVVAGSAAAPNDLVPASPRPLAIAPGHGGRGGRVAVSGRQLLINQRVSQAAIRRLNGLRERLDGRLTGGDLAPGAVGPGKLATDLRILSADAGVPRPAASRTRVAVPGPRSSRTVPITARQLRINQRIAQAAVRRSNALADELRAGLTARHFAEGTVVAANLDPRLRP